MSKATGKAAAHEACPCGGARFADCCGRFLTQQQLAATPEALMRSRYSAYVRADEAYLRATWHPRTCPQGALLDPEPGLKWLGLAIKAASVDGGGEAGTVEFVARYKVAGRARRLHEVSRFVREGGSWLYLDGQFPDEAGVAGGAAEKSKHTN